MYKLRFCFEKNGPAAYISHLDLMKALQRSFVRAGIPVKYSQGFNPHIEMSIVVPLSTGYETRCDLCDLDLTADALPEHFAEELNAVMPMGMKVLYAGPADRPVREICYCAYEILLPEGDASASRCFSSPTPRPCSPGRCFWKNGPSAAGGRWTCGITSKSCPS